MQGTCRGEIDFRIQGLLLLTVQQQDHTRKATILKLIHQFETHPNREALKANLKQNHAFNSFSEQPKDMIYSMGNIAREYDGASISAHTPEWEKKVPENINVI